MEPGELSVREHSAVSPFISTQSHGCKVGERHHLTGPTTAGSPGNPELDLPDILFLTDLCTCGPVSSPGAIGAAGPTDRKWGPHP